MSDLFDEFPSTDTAYYEAASNSHDIAHWKPSHDVVFEAARRVGFSALRRRDTGAGKRGFAKHYKEVCKAYLRGERFKRDVVVPRDTATGCEKLSETEVFERKMMGRARIGELRQMLEG